MGRGGSPDSKDDKDLFCFGLWEDNQNPNTLRTVNPYKIRFKKNPQRQKNTGGGGVMAVLKK